MGEEPGIYAALGVGLECFQPGINSLFFLSLGSELLLMFSVFPSPPPGQTCWILSL